MVRENLHAEVVMCFVVLASPMETNDSGLGVTAEVVDLERGVLLRRDVWLGVLSTCLDRNDRGIYSPILAASLRY